MPHANDDETIRPSLPGLTKPLINNIGGMIDQDAPSADTLLAHSPDGTWDERTLSRGARVRATTAAPTMRASCPDSTVSKSRTPDD